MTKIDPRKCYAVIDGKLCGLDISHPVHDATTGRREFHAFERVKVHPPAEPTPWYIKLMPAWIIAGLIVIGLMVRALFG